jgi:L-alanine-DL-glutamate epimerase-like enolase superfamily enzyme
MSKVAKISTVRFLEWTLPLEAPFRVAKRTAHEAHNVRIELHAGILSGVGASAPVEYVSGETIESVLLGAEAVAHRLLGLSIDRLAPLMLVVDECLADQPSARAGIEMAIFDLWAKHWNIPLWQYFGGAQHKLTTDITIPIVTPAEAHRLIVAALPIGYSALKIKIGDSDGHEADLERITVAAETAPELPLRIDANQAFEPDSAVSFIRAALKISSKIEIVEQPVRKEDFDGLKYVKDHSPIPVFADESGRSYNDVLRLISMQAVDGINIKLMKSGIRGAHNIITLCRQSGIRLMMGCMLESCIGIAAAAALAGGIGGFDFIDLDSHKLLKPVESLQGTFKTNGPCIEFDRTSPGWGLNFVGKQ